MGTLNLEKALYLDGAKSGGLDASLDGTTSSPPSIPYSFMSGDKFTLNVYFRERSAQNGTSTAMTLAAGSKIVVAGKVSTPDGSLLFTASGFTVSGEAYVGAVNLDTEPIRTIMTPVANGAFLDMFLDIEVSNADDSKNLTFRANCRLYKQAYAGETQPSPLTLPPTTRTSPDGSVFELGVSNDGQSLWTKVA